MLGSQRAKIVKFLLQGFLLPPRNLSTIRQVLLVYNEWIKVGSNDFSFVRLRDFNLSNAVTTWVNQWHPVVSSWSKYDKLCQG